MCVLVNSRFTENPSMWSYMTPVFLQWRCYSVDYRPLDIITIKNRYPLHHIDLLFDQLVGAQVFSKIDLWSGYHQIKVRAEDISKMAFSTRYYLYEYVVMSFRLINSPTHFMYLMNSMFMPELDKSVIISLMTFWCTRRVWKNMRNTSVSCFNDYESTNCMPSSVSANFGWMKWHSWATWYCEKESQWTPARYKMCWNGSHRSLYIKSTASLGWLAII
jgi:hypothetical protein